MTNRDELIYEVVLHFWEYAHEKGLTIAEAVVASEAFHRCCKKVEADALEDYFINGRKPC